jgi:hypothetical protein
MPSLPPVYVELRATAQSFTAAMQSAQNELKKTADVGQSNMDRMAQVGKVAFAGLATAAIGFGATAVKAALDGQQAHAQLVQAVSNSGTAFSSVGGEVDGLSDRFANLGYENDAVEQALTRLVTASGNTQTAMDNMGLAADLARARHISLEDAAGGLGKILAGNLKGMAAFGLSAKDAGGNSLTAAQAIAELNQRFGGAAAAQAGTYAGQLDALHAKFSNLQETVGNQLLPVLARLGDVVADGVGWIERNGEAAAVMAGVVGGPLVAAIGLFIVRQAMAFGTAAAQAVNNVGRALLALVPAAEAAEVAESGLAATTAVATGGLSLLGAGAALLVTHFLGHAKAAADVASATAGAQGAVDGMTGAEDGLGGATGAATSRLKEQADLFTQLSGDTNAQASEILKLIGDQQALDQATLKLTSTSKTNTQVQKDATTAAKNLSDAQEKVTKATDAYNKLQAGLGQRISRDHVDLQHNLTQAQLSNEEAQRKVTDAVAEYGVNSFEARQANLDLESSYITLQDAQTAMGTEGQAAWDEVNAAQQAVTDAGQAVQDAIDKQREAVEKLNKPSSDVAANTLAWQQAQLALNGDWDKFSGMLATNPEIRDQLAATLKRMKENLPKGADTKPLSDLLDKLDKMATTFSAAAPPNSMLDRMLQGQGALPPGAAPSAMLTAPSAVITSPTGMSPSTLDALTGRRAFGGPVLPGGTYLVGEQGPELLRMGSTAGTVSPGAGGVTVIINVAGSVTSERDLALTVREELLKLGRNMVGVGLGG